jgi:hypothetical protein
LRVADKRDTRREIRDRSDEKEMRCRAGNGVECPQQPVFRGQADDNSEREQDEGRCKGARADQGESGAQSD